MKIVKRFKKRITARKLEDILTAIRSDPDYLGVYVDTTDVIAIMSGAIRITDGCTDYAASRTRDAAIRAGVEALRNLASTPIGCCAVGEALTDALTYDLTMIDNSRTKDVLMTTSGWHNVGCRTVIRGTAELVARMVYLQRCDCYYDDAAINAMRTEARCTIMWAMTRYAYDTIDAMVSLIVAAV